MNNLKIFQKIKNEFDRKRNLYNYRNTTGMYQFIFYLLSIITKYYDMIFQQNLDCLQKQYNTNNGRMVDSKMCNYFGVHGL